MGKKKKSKYAAFQKGKAAIIILAFIVVLIAGFQAGVSVSGILQRATIVVLSIMVISRIVVQILVTSEEMNSGES